MIAVNIRKEEQSKYCTFDKVNVLQEQIEATGLEIRSDGQIVTTKYSQTVHILKITPIEESEEESSLEKCCCYCFSTCSCDKLMSKCTSCQNLCQDSHLFIKKHVRKAQSLGLKGIYKSLRNIYTETPVGSTVKEACVWGLFISFLVWFLKSFALLIKSKVAGDDSYDYWFKLLGTIFSGFGLIFSFFDTLFHVYHRRFKTCKEWKKWRKDNLNNDSSCCLRCLCCKRNDPNLVNKDGSAKYEATDKHRKNQSDTLAAEEDSMAKETTGEDKERSKSPDPVHCCRDMCMCCPRSITILIDVSRVLFAETLFYLSLILSVFELCTELVINNNDPHMIKGTTWFSFIFSFFTTLSFNYIARGFILAGTVYSVAKIRDKENIFEGAIFQIMFVLYSYGLMALQICMIVAIGGAYYNEYNEKYTELTMPMNISNASSVTYSTFLPMNFSRASSENYTTSPIVDINYSPSGRMWYVMVCGYITPILGIIMFFVVCHYWTQQFPIDVILDILKSLKSSVMKAVLITKVGEEYVETLERLSKHLNERKIADYKDIQNLNFLYKFGYPFKRPVHIILCFLYIAILIGFFVCCGISGSGRAWILYYFSVLVFGLIVNWYVFLVTLFWLVILLIILVIITVILYIITAFFAIILFIFIMFCCATVTEPDKHQSLSGPQKHYRY